MVVLVQLNIGYKFQRIFEFQKKKKNVYKRSIMLIYIVVRVKKF